MQGIDKILCPMGNYPLLLYTLIPFQNSDSVDEIVIVTREDLMLPIGDLCRREGMHKVTRIVKGGASRTESVLEGLHAADPKADLVAIHDRGTAFPAARRSWNTPSRPPEHGGRLPRPSR